MNVGRGGTKGRTGRHPRMYTDVVDLREFYESNLGQTARRMLRRRVRQLWPDVSGQVVLGLGYPTPLLRAFRSEAERVVAVMPARQGVARWPQDGLSLRSEERRVGKECGSTCRSRV